MGGILVSDVCDALSDAGVDLAATLPDTWLVDLISGIDADRRFRHIPVVREESALALCGGAFFAGRSAVSVIGTSGFSAAIYAVSKICLTYEIGVPILTDMRGDIGEKATHHYSNAIFARPVLAAMQIPVEKIASAEQLDRLPALINHARLIKRPVLISLPKPTLG